MSFRSSSGSYTEHDILGCDICLEHFDEKEHEAKFLSCHHSFCQVCLGQLKNGDDHIECPTCRQHTSLPDAGISGLQTNFYIAYMMETFNKLETPKINGCQKHSNQPLSFFCQKCNTDICRDCTVLDHKEANGHVIQDIALAEVQQRQGLATLVEDVRSAHSGFQSQIQRLEAETSNLSVAKDITLKEIESMFEEYLQVVEARKLKLTKEVFDMYNKRHENLQKMTDDFGVELKSTTNMMSDCNKLVKKGLLSEIITNKKTLNSTFTELKRKARNLNPGRNYLSFQVGAEGRMFEQRMKVIGGISSEEYLPTEIKFIPQALTAGLRSKIHLYVHSYNGNALGHYAITVVITDPTNTHIQNTIMPYRKGQYVLTFLPQMQGEHRFVGAFHGQTIKGGEITIKVNSNNPIQKFGEQGTGEGKFLSPRAVAVDTDGSMYIADTGNRLIQKIDARGKFLHQFCINTEKPNRSTCDLALNLTKGLIVCTETMIGGGVNPTTGNVVMVYDRTGDLQDVFTNKVMKCALCIATNSRGDIIVSDYLVHSLFMYDDKGTYIRRIGHSGHFDHPAFICIGENDNIIVSDTNNDCVHIFDKDGNFLHKFGRTGSGKGELRQPFGVASDKEHILVVDSGNRRIQIFTKDGQFVSMVESSEDPLEQPRGMAITNDGFLYIADRDNHCVKKYKYKDVPPNKQTYKPRKVRSSDDDD